MDITGLSPASASSPRTAGPAAGAGALASDFDTFLRMLTVQIRNQDPLNPQSATDFAVQLATFSTVEQQVRTNRLLEDLAGSSPPRGSPSSPPGWARRRAPRCPPASTARRWRWPRLPRRERTRRKLVVRDAAGREVERLAVPPGARSLTWTGRNAEGAPYLSGLYSFELVSFREGAPIASSTVETWARIEEAQAAAGQTVLVLAGGVSVAAQDVRGLRAPP